VNRFKQSQKPWSNLEDLTTSEGKEAFASVCHAVRMLSAGEADAHHQTKVFDFIVNDLCDSYGMSYRPDNHSATDFAEGKRWVGMQLVRIMKTVPSDIRGTNRADSEHG